MTQPASKSPLNALQKVFVARLRADATLSTLLGGSTRVVDQPPEGEAKPYVRVGDHTSTADNVHGKFGRSIVETFHIWTKARGNTAGQDIANRIVELLDHQHAALTAALAALTPAAGHSVVSIRHEFDQALTDPDPEIRHHVLRFRVETAQLS